MAVIFIKIKTISRNVQGAIEMSNNHCCLALLLVLGSLGGCSTIDKVELADGDARWGGYSRNTLYEIQHDVFLLKLSEPYGKAPVNLSLTPEASFRAKPSVYGAPNSVRQYLVHGDERVSPSSGRKYLGTSTVKGIVRAGTRILVLEAVDYSKWNWFFGGVSRVVVYADILSGEFKGSRVDIQDLSSEEYFNTQDAGGLTVLRPDSGLIKYIDSRGSNGTDQRQD